MLHLIPAPAHRFALRLAHGIRWRWWQVMGIRPEGCRVLALDGQGQVLLVRHSYGSRRWMLPGGGLGRNETPIEAARRELAEETGLDLEDPQQLDLREEPLFGTIHKVHLICGQARGQLCVDGRELTEAGFFPRDGLPSGLSPVLENLLPLWLDRNLS